MKTKTLLLATAIFVLAFSASSTAMPILGGSSSDGGVTWTASDVEGRSAEALFSFDGTTLSVILRSLATETSQPNEVLAGLFFSFGPYTVGLTNPHVEVASGATLHVGKSDMPRVDGGNSAADRNLDGEYGYLAGINQLNGGLGEYGISNTAFDPEGAFPTAWKGFGGHIIDQNVAYPKQINTPNGPSFGIVAGDISGLVASITSYVTDAVLITFTLTNPASFNLGYISQVNFLYGTSFTAPVPEPATVLLFGAGLIGIAGLSRRRMRQIK